MYHIESIIYFTVEDYLITVFWLLVHGVCSFPLTQNKKGERTPHPVTPQPFFLKSTSALNSPFCLNREPKLLILYWQTVLLALLYYPAGPLKKSSVKGKCIPITVSLVRVSGIRFGNFWIITGNIMV